MMVLESILLGGLLLGADVGWRPLPDGEGMEYLIQLSPSDLNAMKLGEAWMTDIPASVGNVRAYRVTIGNERLPRVAPPPTLPPDDAKPPAADPLLNRIEPGPAAKPLAERQAVYMAAEPGDEEPAAAPATGQAREPDASPPRPWMLLVGTALALAGSLGGNAYLLWGLREAHRRYQDLAASLS